MDQKRTHTFPFGFCVRIASEAIIEMKHHNKHHRCNKIVKGKAFGNGIRLRQLITLIDVKKF